MTYNIQKKIRKTAPSRVSICFEIETYNSVVKLVAGFKVGIIGNFGKNTSKEFVSITPSTFDSVMKKMQCSFSILVPAIAINMKDIMSGIGPKTTIECKIEAESLECFTPNWILSNAHQDIANIYMHYRNLCDLQTKISGSPKLLETMEKVVKNADVLKAVKVAIDKKRGIGEIMDLGGVLSQAYAESLMSSFVETIASFPFKHVNVKQYLAHAIATIYESCCKQVDSILHNEKFQDMEGQWRGVNKVLSEYAPNVDLSIHLINVEWASFMNEINNAIDISDTNLYKSIYRDEYNKLGGMPFSLIVMMMDLTPQNLTFHTKVTEICSAAHCINLVDVSPKILGLDDMSGLKELKDVKKAMSTADNAPFLSFQKSPLSRYTVGCLPKWMSRQPYGKLLEDPKFPEYKELVNPSDNKTFLWSSSSCLVASVIVRSFVAHGWPADIIGLGADLDGDGSAGGRIDSLPSYSYIDEYGNSKLYSPIEVSIDDSLEKQLSSCGFCVIHAVKHMPEAVLMAANNMHIPRKMVDDRANDTQIINSGLQNLMCSISLIHLTHQAAVHYIGSADSPDQIQQKLQSLLSQYTLTNHKTAPSSAKARKPFADSLCSVEQDKSDKSSLKVIVKVVPHYKISSIEIDVYMASTVSV